MTNIYNYILHKSYQSKINNQINIRDKIFKALDIYKKLITEDDTDYPDDQSSLYRINFPLSGTRSFPELGFNDYVICLNNYRSSGDLFTIRSVHPVEKYCEVVFLDPNNKGQTWLLIIGSELGDIEEIRKGVIINLTTDLIDGIYY